MSACNTELCILLLFFQLSSSMGRVFRFGQLWFGSNLDLLFEVHGTIHRVSGNLSRVLATASVWIYRSGISYHR